MAQPNPYIESLILKFERKEINSSELDELIKWYNSHDDENVTVFDQFAQDADTVKFRILNGLLDKINQEKSENKLPKKFVPINYWIAASVIGVLISITILFFWRNSNFHNYDVVLIDTNSIQPGNSKATLLLAEGKQINLDTAQAGIVMDNTISYNNGEKIKQVHNLEPLSMLELIVPKGGIYELTLSDGTKVWLNSDSRLKYPAKFTEQVRNVELVGEAYFDVKTIISTNSGIQPFTVKTNNQIIEVLGTEFNINSYNKYISKTTLIEGKVNVKHNSKELTLAPGQQAISNRGRLEAFKVDVKKTIAWKESKFNFDEKSFSEIMEEIVRWYNLDIEYINRIPNVELVGDAYRSNRIALILRMLDAVEVKYKLDIKNRKLIIY